MAELDIGGDLQRIGAALSGRLGQFDAGQAARGELKRKRGLDELKRRQKGAAVDFRQVNRFLKAGDTTRALELLQNRVQAVDQLGGDSKDTAGLMQQIQSGDIAGAMAELRALDNMAIDRGILERQPAPAKREIKEDIKGTPRFVDTGGAVFSGAENRALEKQDELNKEAANKARKLNFDQSDKLRDEFVKQSGDFVKIRDAFERVNRSAKDPSPAGDLALIFNYMKILDPGSTVREGEFATAQNSAGVPERIRATFNRIISGEKLGPKQRADFVNRAATLFEGQRNIQQKNVDRYTKLADIFELDPATVVSDLSEGISDPNEETIPAPAPAVIPEVTPAPALDPNRFKGFKILKVE